MWTSSIAAAARTAASPPASPAQSRTSIGRSRLPPASRVALGVRAEQLAVAADLLAQQLLDLAEPRRQPAARGVEHRRHRRRHGGAAASPATPLWIVTIPPARIV